MCSVKIGLSKGQWTTVDLEDFQTLSQRRWRLGSGGYAVSEEYYGKIDASGKYRQKTLLMHRVIMDAPSGIEVDHINGDKLDNRRQNLRLCSRRQNSQNKSPHLNSASGFKGVVFWNGIYAASICCNGKRIHLGHFETPEDAAYAYNQSAIEYFGCFARLNILPEGFIGKLRKTKNKTSKYKGVSWASPVGKWQAQVMRNRKSYHLGYFKTEEEAADAYSNFKLRTGITS